jgi:hypothetical protein
MSVLVPSRIPRSALLCPLTILSLATFAHATVPTALGTAIPLDESGKIIGIIGGVIAIIGGISGFVYWLRGIKSKWIQEAVKQADNQCQSALSELRKDITGVLIEMEWKLTPAGAPREQEQRAAAAKRALLSFLKRP